MRKIVGLVCLLALGALTGVETNRISAEGESTFFSSTSYDLTSYVNSAPSVQGENGRYVAYGFKDQFYEMIVGTDPTKYVGDDLNVSEDMTFIYNRHEFCADTSNVYLIWQAQYNGTVSFLGGIKNSYSYADHAANSRDGIKFSIYRRATKTSQFVDVESKTINEDFQYYFNKNKTFTVTAGECFFFELDPLGSCAWDSMEFYFDTQFTKSNPSEVCSVTKSDVGFTNRLNWKNYYSNAQGTNNYFYLYGSPNAYALMEYTTRTWLPDLHWHGIESDQYIRSNVINPGAQVGTLVAWVAESDGVISLKGYINPYFSATSGTDGFIASVYKNNQCLFTHDFVSNWVKAAVLPDSLSNISVVKGDIIFFYVNSGYYSNSGWDTVSFKVELSWVEKGTTSLTAEQVRACIVESEYEQILGIKNVDTVYPGAFTVGEVSKGCNGGVINSSIMLLVFSIVSIAYIALKNNGGKKHENN